MDVRGANVRHAVHVHGFSGKKLPCQGLPLMCSPLVFMRGRFAAPVEDTT